MDWMSVLTASATLVVIAIILGLVLAIANKFLSVKEDPRKGEILNNLPGANCGACGYPGCAGLASALIDGEVKSVKTCKVIKADKAKFIAEYLSSTPGPDGNVVKVSE